MQMIDYGLGIGEIAAIFGTYTWLIYDWYTPNIIVRQDLGNSVTRVRGGAMISEMCTLKFFHNSCGAEQHQHVALCLSFVLFCLCLQKNIWPLLGKKIEIWFVECTHKKKINQGVMIGW